MSGAAKRNSVFAPYWHRNSRHLSSEKYWGLTSLSCELDRYVAVFFCSLIGGIDLASGTRPVVHRTPNAALETSVQRVFERPGMREEGHGVAMGVLHLNSVKRLTAWYRNVSGLFDPLEFCASIVTGAEGFDSIAGFDVLGHDLPRNPLAGLGRFALLGFHRFALFAVQGSLCLCRGHGRMHDVKRFIARHR